MEKKKSKGGKERASGEESVGEKKKKIYIYIYIFFFFFFFFSLLLS